MTLDEAIALLKEFGPNCLLGICCPPEDQRVVLMKALVEGCGLEDGAADKASQWILDHFDLAPKDQFTPLLRKAGELAVAGT